MAEFLIALFLVLGGVFTLIGSIGLARLPDTFMRLHGPAKATTLGVGGTLVASAISFSGRTQASVCTNCSSPSFSSSPRR